MHATVRERVTGFEFRSPGNGVTPGLRWWRVFPGKCRDKCARRRTLTVTNEGTAVRFERITINPKQMGGLPCIRGLRIPVSTVIGQLAAGRTHAQVLSDFPDLEPEDIYAALEFAATAVQERELPLVANR